MFAAVPGAHSPDLPISLRANHLRPRPHLDPQLIERREQGGGQTARVDARLPGDVRPAPDRGREPWLECPAVLAAKPLRVEAERPVELVAAPELLGLVAIHRHVKGAAHGELDRRFRIRLQIGGEIRPAAKRLLIQGEQALLAPRRLADRGEHPGGHAGCARCGPVPLEHADAGTRARGAPCRGQADHAATDEDRVVAVSVVLCHLPPSVGRLAGLQPPCAGITRIRFIRSAAPAAALSALGGLPFLHPSYPRAGSSRLGAK